MRVFILLSFLFLGWLYWELSGGADFVPGTVTAEPDIAPADGAGGRDGTGPLATVTAPDPDAAPVSLPAGAATPHVTRADTAPAALDALAAGTRTPLPESPLAPGEALASIAPDLAGRIEEALATALVAPQTASGAAADASAAGDASGIPGGFRIVTGDRVNMRAGPGTGFEVVGQLVAGQRTEVLGAEGNWLRVRGEDGTEGWMSARYLAPLPDG